jgi:hypothetical protein
MEGIWCPSHVRGKISSYLNKMFAYFDSFEEIVLDKITWLSIHSKFSLIFLTVKQTRLPLALLFLIFVLNHFFMEFLQKCSATPGSYLKHCHQSCDTILYNIDRA